MLPAHTLDASSNVLAALDEHPLEAIGKMLCPASDDHGLANRLIVGSNDGGTISFDLQHQQKYVVIVISSSCKLRYYHSTRKETKRDDFHATDHWLPRIGFYGISCK